MQTQFGSVFASAYLSYILAFSPGAVDWISECKIPKKRNPMARLDKEVTSFSGRQHTHSLTHTATHTQLFAHYRFVRVCQQCTKYLSVVMLCHQAAHRHRGRRRRITRPLDSASPEPPHRSRFLPKCLACCSLHLEDGK